ncbi:MAG: PorT family protein [Bacteroidota bacterium]|nr:PorT family protein [Bacteroidota bacterium]
MERKFSINDFEESLKDHADQFKMIPSKKVWHGLYNDLHPGRRWPSITISLVLVFILVGVGYLNTHNFTQTASTISKNTVALNNSLVNPQTKVEHKIVGSNYLKEKVTEKSNAGNTIQKNLYLNSITLNTQSLENNTKNLQLDNLMVKKANNSDNIDNLNTARAAISNPANSKALTFPDNFNDNLLFNASPRTREDQQQIQDGHVSTASAELLSKGEVVVTNNPIIESTKKISSLIEPTEKVNNSIDEKLSSADKKLSAEKITSSLDVAKKTTDVTQKILKLHKKRNEKVNWVYYAAPVMSTVAFKGQAIKEVPSTNFSIALAAASQKQNKVLHNPSLGFEAGAQMEYNITKKLQFTTGAHLTYSGYKIISNEVHPTFATLILRDPKNGVEFPMSYLSHYGDGTGQTAVTLRNYSWQASIPIGLQYQFSGNNKIQFHAGANVEPSYVLKSDAYILSSDGRNYVNDPSLLRRWNMSSNFNAFITFRSHNLKWNIGPNVRYQWFSTYQKSYTIKEHLIDYGIRIGISK